MPVTKIKIISGHLKYVLRQNDYAHVFAKRKLPLANIFQDKKFAYVFTEGLVWQIFARISA
jgi:hypothetical protein